MSYPHPESTSRYSHPCANFTSRGRVLSTNVKTVAYYEQFDEWGRLDTPAGRLEFKRTLKYVLGALEADSKVLDLGGGPGRYAIALAERGHTLSLVDLSPKLIDEAKRRVAGAGMVDRVPDIAVGQAEDLSSFPKATFDAVLAFGPFYHLIEQSGRLEAASEIMRVLRPGGLAFIAFIPRASGIAGLISRAAHSPEQVTPETMERVFADGVFINPTESGFQNGYYPPTEELESLFAASGFDPVDVFSVRGLYFGYEQEAQSIRENSPGTADAFEEGFEPLFRDREVIAHCGHALLVVRKPE